MEERKRLKSKSEERILPPKSKLNCDYCKQPVLGKGYLVQQEYNRRNFCAGSCYEYWKDFQELIAIQKKKYAMEDNSYAFA
jgi:hypothetical protein